jgi:hypothetical protein
MKIDTFSFCQISSMPMLVYYLKCGKEYVLNLSILNVKFEIFVSHCNMLLLLFN